MTAATDPALSAATNLNPRELGELAKYGADLRRHCGGYFANLRISELTPDAGGPDRAQPACWGVDPELFFGPADSPLHGRLLPWEQLALAVCAHCPVQSQCLAEALEFPAGEQHGVIGGSTAGQRRVLLASHHRPSRSSITDTAADRQRLVAAAVRLHQAGHGARQIAAQLDVNERRVHRWLTAHRADLGVA